MGKIIRDKYPDLSEQDQEAIRQRAVAALNLIQMGGKKASGSGATSNTALIDGIRRYVTDVRDLNVDLIDSINPFGEAYNILAKTMNEERLRQVQSAIAGRRVQLTPEEARDLAKRALKFKNERGRLPSITSQDAWERRMAEGIAFLARMKQEKTSG
jgi:asparagine synthetase A